MEKRTADKTSGFFFKGFLVSKRFVKSAAVCAFLLFAVSSVFSQTEATSGQAAETSAASSPAVPAASTPVTSAPATRSSFFTPAVPKTTTLVMLPQEKYCFTNTECCFYIKVPGVSSDKISFYNETPSSSITFLLSKQESYIDEAGKEGSLLQIWFSFKDAGQIQLPDVNVHIGKQNIKAHADPVTVYENPAVIQPKLSIVFDGFPEGSRNITVHTGDHIKFTLYINYVNQIVNFKWVVPQDSVFKELERYNVTSEKTRSTSFTPVADPIARFDWQPLKKGEWKLPGIMVVATGYNGDRYELIPDDYTVTVLQGNGYVAGSNEKDSAFAYAFAEPLDSGVVTEDETVTLDAEQMLKIRRRERKCFPGFPTPRRRKALELKAGITVSPDEPNIPFVILLVVLFIVCVTGTVFHFIYKNEYVAYFSLILSFLLLIGIGIESIRFAERRAIFKGGDVRPIPELNSSSSVTLPEGSCVIKKSWAGDWVYIRSNDTYGWVQKENLLDLN